MSQLDAVKNGLSQPVEADQEIDMKALASVFLRQKWLILGVTAFTTVSALVLSLMLPKTYVAQATLLPTDTGDARSAVASGIAAQLGAVGTLGGLGMFGGGKSADLVEILSSRSMAERIIQKNHLDQTLKGWHTRADLVRSVMKMTTVTPPSLKNKIVAIEVQAPQAVLAATMANSYVRELKDMLDEIGYNSASKSRVFIQSQLAKSKEELAQAEEKLAHFQAENRLASLPETVNSSIKAISELESQQIGAEVQMIATDEAAGAISSRVSALQADPNSLVELEIRKKTLSAQRRALLKAQEGFRQKLTSLPPKAMELARMQRDVQVQNAVYLALTQQLETAIISENKESDAFLPLDKADVPDRPSKPKKSLITLIGLLVGLVTGTMLAFARNYFAKGVQSV